MPYRLAIPQRTYIKNGDPYGTRTRVTAVKGRCLNRLTKGPSLHDPSVAIELLANRRLLLYRFTFEKSTTFFEKFFMKYPSSRRSKSQRLLLYNLFNYFASFSSN